MVFTWGKCVRQQSSLHSSLTSAPVIDLVPTSDLGPQTSGSVVTEPFVTLPSAGETETASTTKTLWRILSVFTEICYVGPYSEYSNSLDGVYNNTMIQYEAAKITSDSDVRSEISKTSDRALWLSGVKCQASGKGEWLAHSGTLPVPGNKPIVSSAWQSFTDEKTNEFTSCPVSPHSETSQRNDRGWPWSDNVRHCAK
ncbi:hypothetical protein J6590_045915 [Homalodisca vitripennis]|nr:hypothetical protein J6590_045915 [Homalodisca vitripennis]